MPVWQTAYPQLWDRKRKGTAVVSVRHFAAALSISAGCEEWESERESRKEKDDWVYLYNLPHDRFLLWKWNPSIFPFIFFLTLLNSSLKRFYSRGSVCVLRDMISCILQLWDHMEHLQGTTWNLSKTPLLKSLHALELMYTLSYQLQCLAFWMAISVKQPEIRLKMLSGLVNVYAYLSV